MKRNITFAIAVLLVGMYATEAQAQTVSIKNIDDSKAGQLTITADVEVPQGWTVLKVHMEVKPPKGAAGEGGLAGGVDSGGGVWAATVEGLTSGNTYDVQVVMLVSDPQLKGHRYFSATKSQKVK